MANSAELDLAIDWFDRVWRQEDAKAIDELFPSGEVRGLGAQANMTPEDFKAFHAAMCARVCNINITIDKSVQGGPWISLLCTLNANCRESDKPVTMTGNVWARIENGKILEAYNHFDFMTFWAQLGLLPADAFEQGLMGKKIA